MRTRRLLVQGPSDEPQWIRLYVRQIGETWAAIILDDEAQPPGAGELKGLALFGETPEAAERQALEYLGMQVEQN